MMTPTRKSGRQPKPSTKLKEYLYDNEIEKAKEPASRVADKKKAPPATKEPAPRAAEKKRVPPITKQPAARVLEKRGAAPPIKKGVIERKAPPPIKKGVVERRAPPPIKKGVIERRALQIKKEPEEPPVDKRKSTPVKKEPAPRVPEKKKISQVTKEPAPRVPEKRKISQVTKESPDSLTPSRKSRRTPKPSVKLQEFVYDDEREKSVESVTNKKTPRETEKLRRTVKIKEEIEDLEDEEDEEEEQQEEEEEEEEEVEDEASRRSPVKKKPAREIAGKVRIKEEPRKLAGKMPNHQSGPKRGRAITSPRARVTNLTSLAAKKEKLSLSASRLTVRKGKIYTTSPVSTTRERLRQGKPGANSAVQKKTLAKRSGAVFKERIPLTNKRKREPENLPQANKRINKAKESSRLTEKVNRSVNQKKENSKENKHKVEKKEIEKVLQVNKEVMTQLLNFGAEVAEAMACNNESIFSFSTKDNPLQTFKIDKQDDFSNEEVVKIIKWFEEEEEQRRAYRKRILEALRASHETNMSLYTQMLKMLQSVTAC